jgi:hypothetical protein
LELDFKYGVCTPTKNPKSKIVNHKFKNDELVAIFSAGIKTIKAKNNIK